MEGYLSIIQYFPDINREEGFGIGIILVSEKDNLTLFKSSPERIRRINSAFGLKKSKLIDIALDEYSNKSFDKKSLDYFAVYENGNLRFTKPQIVEFDDFHVRFDEFYSKYVADYYENDYTTSTVAIREIPQRLGKSLRKIFQLNLTLNRSLNIGYDFSENSISEFLIGKPNIDFIGGNGTVYSGEIINLDLNEDSLQKSLFKTITLFEALDKTYSPSKKFDPSDCKILVLEDQAINPEKQEYMAKLRTWHKKAGYGLIIKKSLEDFESVIQIDVNKKNIIPFKEWTKKVN